MIDHFAKPDDELFKAINKGELHRNFQGYTTKGGAQLVGIGLTSIGEGKDYYVQNYKKLDDYEKAIDSGSLPVFKGYKLDKDDELRQFVIMELMSNFSLDIKRLEKTFDISFEDYFKAEIVLLEEFKNVNLITIDDKTIKANETGAMLIRNISMCFDKYLQTTPEQKRRFSKTI